MRRGEGAIYNSKTYFYLSLKNVIIKMTKGRGILTMITSINYVYKIKDHYVVVYFKDYPTRYTYTYGLR